MKRTTENLVKALVAKGYDASFEHTGGGCFAGVIHLDAGKYMYFSDNVPDTCYALQEQDAPYELQRAAWKSYEGGFDFNEADGDVLFSGSIAGSHNVAAIPDAESMALEYVRILKGLGLERSNPELPIEMQEAVNAFYSAGIHMLNLDGEGKWPDWFSGDTGRYPEYLPSFDEFLLDFHNRAMGSHLD